MSKEYYYNCPLPKPKDKKKRKKQNGWKDKPGRRCAYTGMLNAERHELFFGQKNHQNSIDHGFQIDLHPAIHQLFHRRVDKEKLKALNIPGMFPDPIAWMEKEEERLQKHHQRKYELKQRLEHGLTAKEAEESWMKLIGRNYL